MMAVTVVKNLVQNVRELDELNTSKEKLAHDVKKTAQNFFKSSLGVANEEQIYIDDSLNTKSSWLSRILRLSDEKARQSNTKAKSISTNADRPSLRQKMQEVSNIPTSSTHNEIGCDR